MLATFKRLATNESGATAIEYGLICAFIGLFILSALHVVGAELIASLSKLLTAFGQDQLLATTSRRDTPSHGHQPRVSNAPAACNGRRQRFAQAGSASARA